MRLALISDVHGNLPALEAVLADIAGRDVDAIWHLGDLVGYGETPPTVSAASSASTVISSWAALRARRYGVICRRPTASA